MENNNKIKYHDNTIEPQYGSDHKLLDNWDADKKYPENEYIQVYFRIETLSYDTGKYVGFSSAEERKAFYNESMKIFENMGWIEDGSYIRKGKQELYIHPQNISGKVLKNEVKKIAEALEKNNTFYLRWVDVYETIYDIPDEKYNEYLETKTDEVRKTLLSICKTNRRNQYRYSYEVIDHIGKRIMLHRIDDKDYYMVSGQTKQFISNVIDKLITEWYIVAAQEKELIRTINKTEQKKLKLFVEDVA